MSKKKKHRLVLTDKNDPNKTLEFSFIDGEFLIERVTRSESRDKIINEKNI